MPQISNLNNSSWSLGGFTKLKPKTMYKYYDNKGCALYTPNFEFAMARSRKFKTSIIECPTLNSKLNGTS